MPSIFQLSGPFGASATEYNLMPAGMTVVQPKPTKRYGSRFIRTYSTGQFSGLGALPFNLSIIQLGIGALGGILGYRWWMKHKRRR